jgi:archaellum component FlaG (FlaF/FlaG flagellin family)
MKTIIALVVGALLFGGGLAGGMLLQRGVITSQQPATAFERLTVVDYISRPFTRFGMQFTLRNDGSTDLQIVSILINGYSNESNQYSMIGWNGTNYFQPGETGLVWVYYPSYAQAINSAMPSGVSALSSSSQPTTEELEELESWVSSFNCTFTFITSTENMYNCSIPRLGYDLLVALSLSESSSTSYMATESIKITNVQFYLGHGAPDGTDNMTITMQNTGTTSVTVTQITINNGPTNLLTTQFTIPANTQTVANITYAWAYGSNYEIEAKTSNGNEFTYTVTAPTS